MPNRYVREGINSSRAVASLDAATEVFYRRMINVVDDFGRFELDTLLIRSHAFPVHQNISESDISAWLARCEQAGLIVIYEVAGRHYLVLTKTERPRAQNSRYPDPPRDVVEKFGLFTDVNTCPRVKTSAPTTNTTTTTITTPNAGAEAKFALPTARPPAREGDGRGSSCQPVGETPTESQAVEMTATAGIPPDFVRLVYLDWSSRGGKDGAGNAVPWLPYVAKRWIREQNEWKAGTHRGKKHENSRSIGPNRNSGTYNEGRDISGLKSKVR